MVDTNTIVSYSCSPLKTYILNMFYKKENVNTVFSRQTNDVECLEGTTRDPEEETERSHGLW